MEKVQKREGLVCVCAECKKVIKVVGKVAADSAPAVSHGICPECAERLYGSLFKNARLGKSDPCQTTRRGRSGLMRATIS